jgi:hypothetical protein
VRIHFINVLAIVFVVESRFYEEKVSQRAKKLVPPTFRRMAFRAPSTVLTLRSRPNLFGSTGISAKNPARYAFVVWYQSYSHYSRPVRSRLEEQPLLATLLHPNHEGGDFPWMRGAQPTKSVRSTLRRGWRRYTALRLLRLILMRASRKPSLIKHSILYQPI